MILSTGEPSPRGRDTDQDEAGISSEHYMFGEATVDDTEGTADAPPADASEADATAPDYERSGHDMDDEMMDTSDSNDKPGPSGLSSNNDQGSFH